jgi:hypothetical protein
MQLLITVNISGMNYSTSQYYKTVRCPRLLQQQAKYDSKTCGCFSNPYFQYSSSSIIRTILGQLSV